MEIMDKEGTKMSATIFGDLLPVYLERMIIGNVYEISQGILKCNTGKFSGKAGNAATNNNGTNKSDICFIFDKHTQLRLCDDDPEIPSLETLKSEEASRV